MVNILPRGRSDTNLCLLHLSHTGIHTRRTPSRSWWRRGGKRARLGHHVLHLGSSHAFGGGSGFDGCYLEAWWGTHWRAYGGRSLGRPILAPTGVVTDTIVTTAIRTPARELSGGTGHQVSVLPHAGIQCFYRGKMLDVSQDFRRNLTFCYCKSR